MLETDSKTLETLIHKRNICRTNAAHNETIPVYQWFSSMNKLTMASLSIPKIFTEYLSIHLSPAPDSDIFPPSWKDSRHKTK